MIIQHLQAYSKRTFQKIYFKFDSASRRYCIAFSCIFILKFHTYCAYNFILTQFNIVSQKFQFRSVQFHSTRFCTVPQFQEWSAVFLAPGA